MRDPPVVLASANSSTVARESAVADGFRLVDLRRVPPDPWDLRHERIVATGVVRTIKDVAAALHVVTRGGGLIAELGLDAARTAALFDDLRRLRPDFTLESDPGAEVTEADRALIRLLASGSTVTCAAKSLFISRRTAVRRLAHLRAKAEATSNQKAIVWFMDRDLVDPVTPAAEQRT